MPVQYKFIGQRVKESRVHAKISQQDLAEILSVSTSYMSLLESGKRRFTLENLALISEYLKIPVEYFIAGTIMDEKELVNREFYALTSNCDTSTAQMLLKVCQDILLWKSSGH